MESFIIFCLKKSPRLRNAVHLICYIIFVGSNLFERGININLNGYFSILRAIEFAPTHKKAR